MNGSPSAYNVALSIFRARCWVQQFTLYAGDGSPLDLSGGGSLVLVVIPGGLPRGNSGVSAPVLSNNTPQIDSNTATFQTSDEQTAVLHPQKSYQWQLLHFPAASTCSRVVIAGPLQVLDSPPMGPTINPL